VAAALVALYGAMALLEVKVMASTLAVFGSLLALALLVVARERGWRAGALLPGLALGLACLARPNTLAFVPLAALWLAWDPRRWREPGRGLERRRLIAAAALVGGTLLAIAPATLRNHAVSGEWVLVSSQGGLTFYQANNADARGLYTRLPGFAGTPADLQRQARAAAERAAGRPLGAGEVSRYWTVRGLRWLSGEPLAALRLLGLKLHHWLGSDELSTEYVLPVERDWTPRLRWLPVPFGVILGLALLGLREAWRRAGTGDARAPIALLGLFAASNLATVLLFYFSSRYRLPAVPALAVFAGGGAVAALAELRERRRGAWVWLSAAAILAAYSLHSWTNHLRDQAGEQIYNYGKVYHQRGLYPAAIARYQEALPYFPGRPSLHFDLGNAQQLAGDADAALRAYDRALELAPGHRGARQQRERLQRRRERGAAAKEPSATVGP
jgi:hypothetical protein